MGEPNESEINELTNLTAAEQLDLLAVAKMLNSLSEGGDLETISAVRQVYFAEPKKHLKRNDISLRIKNYALENYCCERTAWKLLERAWMLCAKIRGLRF